MQIKVNTPIDRRSWNGSNRFMTKLSIALSLVTLSTSLLGAVQSTQRPNVLLVCVDDLRNCLSLDGDPIAQTPHLDRLASTGRYFRSHYVQVPACGPSRCSLLTGRRIIRTWDVWHDDRNLVQAPENPVSMAHHFRRHGYATVSIGKVSHEPGGTMPPEYEIPQMPFSWDRAFAPVGHWASPWHAFFAYSDGRAYNAVIGWVKDEPPRLPFECAQVGDDGYADHFLADAGIAELKRLSEADRPFFLAVGFYKPHLPHNAPAKYWDLFPEESVGMPDNFFPPKHVDPSICIHKSPELTAHYHWPGGLGQITQAEAIHQRRAYYAAVAYVDAQIGRLLDGLAKLPCARETLVVLWSDHGWQLGEHRMFSKHANYEVATRSPLIIKVPGMSMPGVPTQGLAESVDVYPTLVDLCGLPRPNGLVGQSLRPMLNDPLALGKPGAYSTHSGGRGYHGHALRTPHYRLVRWIDRAGQTGLVELYDHKTDPHENVNVAEQFPALVQTLTRRLEQKMSQVVQSSHANN